MKGASPQDIGHQVMTRMQPKIVSSPASFHARGVGEETKPKVTTDLDRFNEHSSYN